MKKLILLFFISIILSNFGFSETNNCLIQQYSHYSSDLSFFELLDLDEIDTLLYIDPNAQRMYYFNSCEHREYVISTGKNPVNIEEGTGGTPWGLHKIDGKIGDGMPKGMVFQSREPISKFYWECEENDFCGITTRILRLRGLEPGINSGPCAHRDDNHSCDSYDRYIYIHGTRHESKLGTPLSAGCILLSNDEIIELFDHISDGTFVYIAKPNQDSCILPKTKKED